MICKNCGREIDDKAIICVRCGAAVKTKKSIYKKWWFWAVSAIVVLLVALLFYKPKNIEYEVVDVSTMLSTAEENPIKAEELYNNKYVEITGKIKTISSKSIYLEPDSGTDYIGWLVCYINKKEQKAVLANKKEGDVVTVKGLVKVNGRFYDIRVKEIE